MLHTALLLLDFSGGYLAVVRGGTFLVFAEAHSSESQQPAEGSVFAGNETCKRLATRQLRYLCGLRLSQNRTKFFHSIEMASSGAAEAPKFHEGSLRPYAHEELNPASDVSR